LFSGLLIFLNTFASHILYALGLPVLLLWPKISIRIFGKATRKPHENIGVDKGEFMFTDNPDGFREKMFRLLIMYQVFNGLKVSKKEIYDTRPS
jgi:hypothetical protein